MNNRPEAPFIIGIIFMLFFMFGNPLILIPVVGIAAVVFFLTRTNNNNPNFNIQNQKRGTTYSSRMAALDAVRLYLAPHNSIWKNLRVSNKFCTLRLGSDGNTITGSEKTSTSTYRKFKIVESKIHTMSAVWNMFCLNFDHLTSYQGLLEMCNTFQAVYIEEIIGANNTKPVKKETPVKTDSENPDEKLDINNATEVEITALPGISIVLSKKIIKRREEINGFKSVDELCKFLKLKPHMENQLRSLICVKKMKGSVNIQRSKERSVDL